MNIAFFLTPKSDVAYLYDDYSFRQGLEKLKHHGYSAIPVITRDGKYVSTVSEGDFLWKLIREEGQEDPVSITETEKLSISDIIRNDKNPPVRITDTIENLLTKSMSQNFIPVIDDEDSFIGIVTRQEIIKYFYLSKGVELKEEK